MLIWVGLHIWLRWPENLLIFLVDFLYVYLFDITILIKFHSLQDGSNWCLKQTIIILCDIDIFTDWLLRQGV